MSGHLRYINKDLFETEKEIIGHSVNTKGAFGSGVAGQIARLYPEVRTHYLHKYRTKGWNLGDVQFVFLGDVLIANMATQKTYGRTGLHTNYEAIRQCLETVLKFASETGMGLAIPRIGCGLGGGNWSKVEPILLQLLQKYSVEVDVHYIS